jgi:dihydroorotate dehydrogenase
LLVKIAPDLTPDELAGIAATVVETGVDGVIVCNTTVARPVGLKDARRDEAGGLSGPPLLEMSIEALAGMYRLTGGRIPLIGSGGVASGADAYAMIRAGASLVQVYTGFIYHGPGLVAEIARDLAAALRRDGISRLDQAVGKNISL